MIDAIFHILNFSLLGGLVWYGARKYLLPTLYQQMNEQEVERLIGAKKLDALHKQHHTLQEAAVHQQELFNQLSVKIDRWRSAMNRLHDQQKEEHQHAVAKLRTRRAQQQAYQKLVATKALVVPVALQEAQRELQEHFADTQRQQQYMAQVVAVLKKERR